MTDQATESKAGAVANASAVRLRQSPPVDLSRASDEEPPTGHVVTDSYAEAADPTGAVTGR
jgi:hypothetical protein